MVTLTATDADGLVSEAELYIVVGDPLDADLDGDGWRAANDYDDLDFDVNPGAEEVCGDAIDNDCTLDPALSDWTAWTTRMPTSMGSLTRLASTTQAPNLATTATMVTRRPIPARWSFFDEKDNDCDGEVDNGGPTYDDDGDCFCEGPEPCVDSVNPRAAVGARRL